ncbi:MAG: PA2169 family four-helix-bundle protein [Pseudomonadaceae bacterium]
MDTKDTISVLNDLIETSKDGEKGFMECAEDLRDPQLKSTMSQRARDCATAAAELQQMVRSLGGEPETSTSMAADMHRRWVDLKSMITGKDDEAILNECERGEDVAVKSYRKALEKDLSAEARLVVERQYQGVLRNHDQVKALRDAARARS